MIITGSWLTRGTPSRYGTVDTRLVGGRGSGDAQRLYVGAESNASIVFGFDADQSDVVVQMDATAEFFVEKHAIDGKLFFLRIGVLPMIQRFRNKSSTDN